ncbi:MAG: methyltransferase domain-containing protein [Ignavibacteriales bacterium]|nr:methyltransferase domain-containing protein [Ignavibacteriales bacterium]
MKLSSLIGHVTELYDETLSSRKPADHLIDIFFRKRKYLGSHDRRFIAETLYTLLRHKRRVEWIISALPTNPKKTLLLVVTALLFEKKYSVQQLSDEQILPTELLQQLHDSANNIPGKENTIENFAVTFSFQDWMVQEWIDQFGSSQAQRLFAVLNTQAPITLRVNTLKATVEDCQQSLKSEGIESVKTGFSPFGLHIPKRINVFQLETFRKGFFEVQDEGSQMLALLVNPKPRTKVIDACAGGGGKTLAMAALMKNRGEIFSLDIHDFRLEELQKRVKRAGVDTVRLKTVLDDESPPELHDSADYVLVDAPCSGTGTIRRNPGMKWSVTPAMIDELQTKQGKILSNYSRCVKVNGTIVYATCSLMKEENEMVVESFLAAHPHFELLNPKGILTRYHLESLANNRYFQLLPHQHGTDGFFAAVMKRIR